MAKRRYTKLEEEIIQILEETDREPGWKRVRRRVPRVVRPHWRVPSPRSRMGGDSVIWLGASFGLALAAILLAGTSHLLAAVLAIAAILVFLSPIAINRRPSGSVIKPAQRWRGQDINLPPSGGGVVGDLRRRLWEYRQRRR